MTDTSAEPAVTAPPLPQPKPARPRLLIGVTAALVAAVVFGLAMVWRHQPHLPIAAEATQISRLTAEVTALKERMAALENRPAAAAGDSQAEALAAELQALKTKTAANFEAFETRMANLENQPAGTGDSSVLAAKLTALDADLKKSVAAAEAHAAMAAHLQAAAQALEAGLPLGDIADAPPALVRFATTAPPTEAALRLSFGPFAAAAEAASRPVEQGHGMAERIWLRIERLITVRQGDHVLIGTPAAAALEAARTKLNAGDLAGAVASLSALDAEASAAMAPWQAAAQALLDARAALLRLMAKS